MTKQKKTCTSCQKEKAVSQFNKDWRGKFGVVSKCKSCQLEYLRQYRKTPKGREVDAAWNASPAAKELKRAYRESEHGKATNAALKRQHRKEGRYVEEKRAYDAVYYAVKTGVLVRPDVCSRCGASGKKIQAHHADYAKPLEVEWLCRVCHVQIHADPPQ